MFGLGVSELLIICGGCFTFVIIFVFCIVIFVMAQKKKNKPE